MSNAVLFAYAENNVHIYLLYVLLSKDDEITNEECFKNSLNILQAIDNLCSLYVYDRLQKGSSEVCLKLIKKTVLGFPVKRNIVYYENKNTIKLSRYTRHTYIYIYTSNSCHFCRLSLINIHTKRHVLFD